MTPVSTAEAEEDVVSDEDVASDAEEGVGSVMGELLVDGGAKLKEIVSGPLPARYAAPYAFNTLRK
tara:strand:+ start:609 stop:806 length:198 start_codon:yes stop_codon:yes gene_type:complete